jgi:hypothetical protein
MIDELLDFRARDEERLSESSRRAWGEASGK